MAFLSVLYPVSIKSDRRRFSLRDPLPLLLLEPLFLLSDERWQVLNPSQSLLYLTIVPEYWSSAKYLTVSHSFSQLISTLLFSDLDY